MRYFDQRVAFASDASSLGGTERVIRVWENLLVRRFGNAALLAGAVAAS